MKRPLAKSRLKSLLFLEQREIWLLVTDVTLQTKEESDPRLPKTLLVYVTPLCVLDSEVLEALAGTAPHSILFKDALQDQGFSNLKCLLLAGRIVCAERTVLLLQKPLLSLGSGVSFCELPGPVMLDSLDSATPPTLRPRLPAALVQETQLLALKGVCACNDQNLKIKPSQSPASTRSSPSLTLAMLCTVGQGPVWPALAGTVVGVDESTAFSWPVCDRCGNGRLEQRPEDRKMSPTGAFLTYASRGVSSLGFSYTRGAFSCGDCSRVVTAPVLKRHLQVFLDCRSRPRCRVKVKLSQRSISSLLRFAAGEDGVSPGDPHLVAYMSSSSPEEPPTPKYVLLQQIPQGSSVDAQE
ncbi:hypothetical protein P7K49_026247 [Saguinus oedipus]|uniref:DUF4503 domain-containing protein n=1 Tax=Saguinus oedipus TaxID=9490 RepID=A0ABQ9UCW9_SAGOE|nr:hypothetical protein P7K49_026247 [Saguinus oedipus]